MNAQRIIAVTAAVFAFVLSPAHADSLVLTGPTGNAGQYSTSSLSTLAGANTVSRDGLKGISLWNLLGGADASNTAINWGSIETSTPAGSNGKNSILRYYVLATGSDGTRSVISLGEIEPRFGGTANNPSAPAFVAFENGAGSLLADPQLVIPNASGRNVLDLERLDLLSVEALPTAPISPSNSVNLIGSVNNPGSYALSDLQSLTAVNLVVGSNTYTGVSLWDFINPLQSGTTDKLVAAKGTDGYVVVHSLAELDPSLGGNPLNLLPYADTGSDLPGSGVARTILPTDTDKRGRWMSNLYEIEIIAAPTPVPLPAAWMMFLTGATIIGLAKLRHPPEMGEQ